jgi:hypothetical protein
VVREVIPLENIMDLDLQDILLLVSTESNYDALEKRESVMYLLSPEPSGSKRSLSPLFMQKLGNTAAEK